MLILKIMLFGFLYKNIHSVMTYYLNNDSYIIENTYFYFSLVVKVYDTRYESNYTLYIFVLIIHLYTID